METKEKNFENDIQARLLAQGYRKGSMATYDKQRCECRSKHRLQGKQRNGRRD